MDEQVLPGFIHHASGSTWPACCRPGSESTVSVYQKFQGKKKKQKTSKPAKGIKHNSTGFVWLFKKRILHFEGRKYQRLLALIWKKKSTKVFAEELSHCWQATLYFERQKPPENFLFYSSWSTDIFRAIIRKCLEWGKRWDHRIRVTFKAFSS